jgi:ABC-type multidrug transport system ATPase subunit
LSKEVYIEFNNVSKYYKNIKAVDNLSLSVFKNDIYGFLGPNGAGKSTSIRMILSLVKASEGTINIFGHDLSKKRKETLSQIGALIEKPDFYKYLSARKNLEILGKISKVKNFNEKIDEVLDLVDLTDRQHSKVKTFSQGMKQRLGIAQTLLHEPKLIILDEPGNGLDPQGQIEMRELILKINKEKGITIVISSHILSEIEQIANRMVIINKGKAVVEGDVKELLYGNNMKVSIKTNNNEKAKIILTGKNISVENNKDKIIINIAQNEIPKLNKELIENDIDVFSIEPIKSLEEYFINMTKND